MPSWPCHSREVCLNKREDCIPSWSTCQACLRKCASVKLMPALLELFHSPVKNWWYLPQCSLGFWIPSRGLWTPDTGFHIFISGTWIPDFLDTGFHKQILHRVKVYCTYKTALVVHVKRGWFIDAFCVHYLISRNFSEKQEKSPPWAWFLAQKTVQYLTVQILALQIVVKYKRNHT